jgi:hypothetical protein
MGVDWSDVNVDNDKWCFVVKTAVNFHVAQNVGISWQTSKL